MDPVELQERTSPTAPGASGDAADHHEGSTTSAATAGGSATLTVNLLRKLLSSLNNPPVTVALPDGQTISSHHQPAIAEVVVRTPRALRRLLIDPLFEFAEGYSRGEIDVLGDLSAMLTHVYRGMADRNAGFSFFHRLMAWMRKPRSNSLSGSRQNISHHYDIGNDFYRLWLDEQMVYTCAYFPDPEMSLEAAQVAKMDHVCRKLRLRPGQHVVEAGCGWGALALHMAERYGVTVKAFNISREQIAYARQEAKRRSLDDRVEFVEDDWRTINERCDVFVSVGMLEHVGVDNYEQLGRVIDRCLKPDGWGLIHSIGQNRAAPVNPWIERRIFPGAYPPSISQMMAIFEPFEFSVLDIENLRLHYARTLHHWLQRFEQSVDKVREMFDERFVRMWRLYLAGSKAGFESGNLQLFQVLFTRRDNNNLPSSRAYMYQPCPVGTDG